MICLMSSNRLINSPVSFGYKIFVDSGASDPKRGTFKISMRSEKTGDEFFSTKQLPEEFKKVGYQEGFNSGDDYIKGLSRCITKSIELAKEEIEKLKDDDKKLSGILINAPGYVVGGELIPYVANLYDSKGEHLKDVDFSKLEVKTEKNTDKYKVIGTNDMHGAAAGIAKMLKEQGRLEEGLYAYIAMTGGGLGVVSIKAKGEVLEIEGCECGHNMYLNQNTDQSFVDRLKSLFVKPKDKPAISLEKGGVSVSGLIGNYAKHLNLNSKQTEALINKGDARIVTDGLLSNNKKEQKAAQKAIETYIDALAQEFARRVAEGVNLIVLSGPLVKGIKNALVEKTGNQLELKDRIMKKIYSFLPESGNGVMMAKIHKFDIDLNLNIPDNTVGGGILLDSAKFIGKDIRGNWLHIPINEL